VAHHRYPLPLHGAGSQCDGDEKATGVPGGGETPNANTHVNALTKSIQPQRGKIDFPKLTDLPTRLSEMDRLGIDMQVISPYPGHFVYAAPPEVARDSCHIVNNHIADGRQTSGTPDGHGHGAAAGSRHGRGRT